MGITQSKITNLSNKSVHAYLSKLDPEIAKYYSKDQGIATFALFLFGCLFCCKLKGDFFSMPYMSRSLFRKAKAKRAHKCCDLYLSYYFFGVKLFQYVGYFLYPILKRRGNIVLLWTPNERSDFDTIRKLYGDNIDGVMTDRPTLLKEWINDDLATMKTLILGKSRNQY